MVTLEIDIIEGETYSDLAQELRDIANRIDEGYKGGIGNYCGTSWGIDGEEEDEEFFEDED
jgi:hypothetical protein